MNDRWIQTTSKLSALPIGTKAQAFDGGYWVKVERGWKWFTGDTFPRPGADFNGKISLPTIAELVEAATPVKENEK